MFVCMQNINLLFTSFLRYYNLTNPEIWLADSIFSRYGDEISITILVFILDYFWEKVTWQNFSNKSRKLYFWAIPGLFLPNFGKKEFSWKRGLCPFLNISIIIVPLCPKLRKTNELFLRKMLKFWTDGQTTVIL